MRTALHETLTTAGYETVLCEDGEAACRSLKAGNIDLVISDVRMPGMGGLDVLKQVRRLPSQLHLLIIA